MTTSKLVIILYSCESVIRQTRKTELEDAKQHLHLLVKTVKEQNTKLAETNTTQELIALLSQAEFDRRNLDREIHASDIERERAGDEAQKQSDNDLKE
jgi:PHD/YefM family antitoxin component YafN of YafNO toxin-antitoxin module